MRIQIRNNLVELIHTIIEGIEYIPVTKIESSIKMFEDCNLAINSIEDNLKENLTEIRFFYYERKLKTVQDRLSIIIEKKERNEGKEKDIRDCTDSLKDIEKSLQNEAEVKLEVVFLPYKYSMWDSLESIWEASNNDPQCNSYVMPIPYYDRDNNRMLHDFIYEGGIFEDNNIEIINYKEYDLAMHRPDVIYFHNPYDGGNFVTSVSPEFYTVKLKEYTDMLVYVPYFIAGPYNSTEEAASFCINSGVQNANKVVLQSDVLKDIYILNGIPKEKIIVLGSPKIDAALKIKETLTYQSALDKEIKGKKVILLNSTISSLLNVENYMTDLKCIMKSILSIEGLALIWRPHPLLESTIKSMRPLYLKDYMELKNLIKMSINGIFDESNDGTTAISLSDGMISDNSSLVQTYIMTGKPVLINNLSKNTEMKALLGSDIYACYFTNEVDVEMFCTMIINQSDPELEKRVYRFKNSLVNTDGDCGIRVHNYFSEIIKIRY